MQPVAVLSASGPEGEPVCIQPLSCNHTYSIYAQLPQAMIGVHVHVCIIIFYSIGVYVTTASSNNIMKVTIGVYRMAEWLYTGPPSGHRLERDMHILYQCFL